MLHKSEVGFGFRRQFSISRKPVVTHEQWACAPISRKRGIGNNSLKTLVYMFGGRVYKGVFIINIEAFIMHIVHDHVHTAQVIGSWIALLPIKGSNCSFLSNPQQERSRTTSGIVHVFNLVFPNSYKLCQH